MAQKKAHEVEAWLSRPQADVAIVLVYGPDRGLVSEQATKYAQGTGLPLDDPFTVSKLDASSLERGRLLDEVNAVAMFAPRRLIWIRGAGADKQLAEDVKLIATNASLDAILLIEAGELRKGAALRAAVEAAPAAMALPCYPDEDRDLDRLLDDELGKAGLEIDRDARLLLKGSLGGDRLATRGELRKLALYAAGQNSVSVADIRAAVSDVAQDTTDDVVDAVLGGDLNSLDIALSRSLSSSSASFLIISALTRRLMQMHVLRGEMDGGKSASAAVAGARPPVMYQQKGLMERALQRWSSTSIESGLARLHRATLQTRQRADLAPALVRQLLLGMAQRARDPGRGRA